jgi:hypothetical protein
MEIAVPFYLVFGPIIPFLLHFHRHNAGSLVAVGAKALVWLSA